MFVLSGVSDEQVWRGMVICFNKRRPNYLSLKFYTLKCIRVTAGRRNMVMACSRHTVVPAAGRLTGRNPFLISGPDDQGRCHFTMPFTQGLRPSGQALFPDYFFHHQAPVGPDAKQVYAGSESGQINTVSGPGSGRKYVPGHVSEVG